MQLQEVKALFEEHFDNLFEPKQLNKNTLTESDSFKETATTTQEEVEHPMEISENLEVPSPSSITETQTEEPKKEKAEKESRLDEDIPIANESDIELKTEIEDGKTIPVTNELETKLQEIFYYLKEFNTEEYQDAKDFVKSLLKTVKKEDDSFIFQTTLSLNILKQGSEFAELNSFNFGDSETLIISVNPSKADINSHISHYRLQQGPLKSYISSSKGKNGRLDISTRKLYENDLLFIGSDGTYFSKTSKVSGNPFSPLHNLIIDCLRKNKLDELPNLWFGKLKSMNALDDDFSLFLITCNKKIEDVKESKDANSFETL